MREGRAAPGLFSARVEERGPREFHMRQGVAECSLARLAGLPSLCLSLLRELVPRSSDSVYYGSEFVCTEEIITVDPCYQISLKRASGPRDRRVPVSLSLRTSIFLPYTGERRREGAGRVGVKCSYIRRGTRGENRTKERGGLSYKAEMASKACPGEVLPCDPEAPNLEPEKAPVTPPLVRVDTWTIFDINESRRKGFVEKLCEPFAVGAFGLCSSAIRLVNNVLGHRGGSVVIRKIRLK